MADTVPAQAPAATGRPTGAATATAPATAGASGTTTGTQPSGTNNPTTGNANANTSTTTTDSDSGNRGLPYYEKLRRDLRDALQKKRLMDKSMVCLRLSPYIPSQSAITWQLTTADRPNSNTKSTVLSNPTSKKPPPETSSRVSTTISRGPGQARGLAQAGSRWQGAWAARHVASRR